MRALCFIFVIIAFSAKGQMNRGFPFQPAKLSGLDLHARFLDGGVKAVNPFLPVNGNARQASCVLKIDPMPLAFFCRMEDKFRNNFHVFFKIRMGDDESYMRMIGRY